MEPVRGRDHIRPAAGGGRQTIRARLPDDLHEMMRHNYVCADGADGRRLDFFLVFFRFFYSRWRQSAESR